MTFEGNVTSNSEFPNPKRWSRCPFIKGLSFAEVSGEGRGVLASKEEGASLFLERVSLWGGGQSTGDWALVSRRILVESFS